MKRTIKKMSKMQRKARSKRKTWTNAQRFQLKHARELEMKSKQVKAMHKFVKQMKEQMAAKELPAAEPERVHSDSCEHENEEPLMLPAREEVLEVAEISGES